jgi:putative holliday junction resolvase
MRLLCLDVGSKTIGLALSDEGGIIASPLRTLTRQAALRKDVMTVAAVMQETEARALVLGLPLDLDGNEGEASRRVRLLGDALALEVGCLVYYWDERFSTAAAERVLIEADLRRKKRKQVINHVAAALILQSFLESRVGKAASDGSGAHP